MDATATTPHFKRHGFLNRGEILLKCALVEFVVYGLQVAGNGGVRARQARPLTAFNLRKLAGVGNHAFRVLKTLTKHIGIAEKHFRVAPQLAPVRDQVPQDLAVRFDRLFRSLPFCSQGRDCACPCREPSRTAPREWHLARVGRNGHSRCAAAPTRNSPFARRRFAARRRTAAKDWDRVRDAVA